MKINLAKIGSNSLSADELIVFAFSRRFQGRSCLIVSESGRSQFSLSLSSGYKQTPTGGECRKKNEDARWESYPNDHRVATKVNYAVHPPAIDIPRSCASHLLSFWDPIGAGSTRSRGIKAWLIDASFFLLNPWPESRETWNAFPNTKLWLRLIVHERNYSRSKKGIILSIPMN